MTSSAPVVVLSSGGGPVYLSSRIAPGNKAEIVVETQEAHIDRVEGCMRVVVDNNDADMTLPLPGVATPTTLKQRITYQRKYRERNREKLCQNKRDKYAEACLLNPPLPSPSPETSPPKNTQTPVDYAKEYYVQHRDRLVEQQRIYRDCNREKIYKQKKENNAKYREKQRAYNREYYKKRKDEAHAKYTKIHKKRASVALGNILSCIQKNAAAACQPSPDSRPVVDAVRAKDQTDEFIKILGCTGRQLKAHIEEQLDSGYDWCNWGDAWKIHKSTHNKKLKLETRAGVDEFLRYDNLRVVRIKDILPYIN